MIPVGFEPTISVGERLQTHALEGTATGTGSHQSPDLNCEQINKHRLRMITRNPEEHKLEEWRKLHSEVHHKL